MKATELGKMLYEKSNGKEIKIKGGVVIDSGIVTKVRMMREDLLVMVYCSSIDVRGYVPLGIAGGRTEEELNRLGITKVLWKALKSL